MALANPLTLRSLDSRNLVLPGVLLMLLTLLAAWLSPHPVVLLFVSVAAWTAAWLIYVLDFSNINKVELNLSLSPDGRLALTAGDGSDIKGVLDGQQWYSSQLAVLRFVGTGKVRHIVLLSAQQNAASYRNLGLWLRQKRCTATVRRCV